MVDETEANRVSRANLKKALEEPEELDLMAGSKRYQMWVTFVEETEKVIERWQNEVDINKELLKTGKRMVKELE